LEKFCEYRVSQFIQGKISKREKFCNILIELIASALDELFSCRDLPGFIPLEEIRFMSITFLMAFQAKFLAFFTDPHGL